MSLLPRWSRATAPSPDLPKAEAALAERIRQGDERAFDRLLEERWALLVAYIVGHVGDVELAQDIVQDAFVRLWERRRDIDPSRSLVAYLYQMARRRAIDELRREEVRKRWAERERRLTAEATITDAPLRRITDREVLAAVERAIAGLPGRRREAFTLVHVQDLSYRQAAAVMGSAPQTVANQVAAALAQLRRELRVLVMDADVGARRGPTAELRYPLAAPPALPSGPRPFRPSAG